MLFKKHPPSQDYEHIIAYFWTLKPSNSDVVDGQYRFVPDAYVDWVFHSGEPWQCDFPNVEDNIKTDQFHVFGQIKKYIDLSLPKQNLDVFAVKFHPWVADKIWNVDMHYLTDSCLSLSQLNLPDMSELQEKIILSKDVKTKIEHIEQYLFSFLNDNYKKSLKYVLSDLSINAHNLIKNQSTGIGLRRLEQRFKNEIGISPKLFSRTIRINKVIEQMKVNTEQSLTQLALANNYYDQSHFIKDFKQFTGLNPSKFLKSINPNGDILNLRVG
ncbi:helix-turn-helix domain-containing protein [Winogradskyella sp.]|uniref:helix-turn-helix domain-containing protein n=1 Tax=Winogradskyella sp. TaxID=1883156 RepID=UPI0025D7C217|nr:helix-turn-helix domain-containing protein [Winogradskyella sp.]